MQIALLVDDSQSAEPFIRDYREALPAFIAAVVADDPGDGKHQISLIGLAGRPTILTPYTSDQAQLLKGVNRIFAQQGSGTYLLEGIREVTRGISKRQTPRPVIVAITTEGPELSDRRYPEILRTLRDAAAPFHVIVVGRPVNVDQDRSVVLNQGSRDTGGQYDNLLTGTALTGRLKKLAGELTHQFLVTYARPKSTIPPEKVSVTSKRGDWTVRGAVAEERRQQGQP
jgi:hypothetical protein